MYQKLMYAMVVSLLAVASATTQGAEFTDNFDKAHDYLKDGVEGTGWDGFIGQGAGETVSALNASTTRPGELYIASAGGNWPGATLGPFLYKVVQGDFVAKVKVTNYVTMAYNYCGLMARVGDIAAAGAGEDFVSIDYFPQYDCGAIAHSVDNGNRAEDTGGNGTAGNPARYLQLERKGNVFTLRTSYDGNTWTDYPDTNYSPLTRTDMAGLPVQVGIWQATFTTAPGNVAFDDFSVTAASILPKAGRPAPADHATDVVRDAVLSWTPDGKAVKSNVYVGTSFADVNAATVNNPLDVLVAQGQDANTYDPTGVFAYGQTYYWRVEGIDANGAIIAAGDVWSFTVELVGRPIEKGKIIATASSQSSTTTGPENTINGSGLDATDLLHSTTTTAMWLTAKGAATPASIQYEFDRVYKLHQMWVWNHNSTAEASLGFGLKNVTIQYSTDGTNFTKLGDFDLRKAPGTANYAHSDEVPFVGVAAKYVKIIVNTGWGTRGQYGLSEVRFFYIPTFARDPKPVSGATGISPDVALSWRPGREAASHKVYLGTDPNVLSQIGSANSASYAPSGLNLSTKYYWRIDEVNTAEAITTWAGDVWSFTTTSYWVVDDMESYTNDDGSRIYQFWADGYETPNTNGSVVGYTTGTSYVETTIRHGGSQSMPFAYNNTGSVANSEATRTFDAIQDWTKYNAKVLTLYFRGEATNATTVPFWVKLTDQSNKTAKVAFGAATGEEVTALAEPAWTGWNIPLSSFTGISLAKIKSITIGLGNGTGSGKLYIDDIRLYPATTTTVTTPTLVGWWKLDNNAQDSSGNGNNGTLTGTPAWVAAGKVGGALSLNPGTTAADYVDCGNGASLNITGPVTLSAWFNSIDVTPASYQDIVGKGDHGYAIRVYTGQFQFYFYDAGGWHQYNSPTYTATYNNAWHHGAATFDGVQARVYVDGLLVTSGLYTGGIASATHNVSIGRNTELTGRWFKGMLDEVRIYKGVLPTSEIVKLANP